MTIDELTCLRISLQTAQTRHDELDQARRNSEAANEDVTTIRNAILQTGGSHTELEKVILHELRYNLAATPRQ